jgi:hypothetical protein
LPKNGNQNDNSVEARVQDDGIQQPVGSNNKHHSIFEQLDRFQVSLGDCGIATSKEEKTMAAGAQMWNSEMFTKAYVRQNR